MWSPSRIAEQRTAKRKSPALALINLWPLMAVSIVLLVVFMVYTKPLHVLETVDMPTGRSASLQHGAVREDAIRITVARDGAIYCNHIGVELPDLVPAVQNAIRHGAEKKAYLAADKHARNIDVERVVDELRRAGVAQIAILTN
jgi:biopolymer transport protein ExbD